MAKSSEKSTEVIRTTLTIGAITGAFFYTIPSFQTKWYLLAFTFFLATGIYIYFIYTLREGVSLSFDFIAVLINAATFTAILGSPLWSMTITEELFSSSFYNVLVVLFIYMSIIFIFFGYAALLWRSMPRNVRKEGNELVKKIDGLIEEIYDAYEKKFKKKK